MNFKFLSLLVLSLASAAALADGPTYHCGPYELHVFADGTNSFSMRSAPLDIQCNNLRFSSSPGIESNFEGHCLRNGISESVDVKLTNTLFIGAYGNDCGKLSISFPSTQETIEYTCSYPGL